MSMSSEDRTAIDQVFGRLAETERRAPLRDAEAEAFIRDHVGRQPGAPYFMAQTIVVQDHALQQAERRIADLEARLAALDHPGSLYPPASGAGMPAAAAGPAGQGGPWSQQPAPPAGPWSQNAAPGSAFRGGGFLAGAAQTAMGVAGGMLIGNAIGSLFGGFGGFGGERVVEEPTIVNEDVTVNEDPQSSADPASPDVAAADDGGGFFDGFFGGDDSA